MRTQLDSWLRIVPRLLIVILVASVAGGCGIFSPDEKTDTGKPVPKSYPLATTSDQLIANFTTAYVERNFTEYDNLVHEEFVFFFAPEDVSLSPSGQGFWERGFEVDSTERMFEGAEGLRPDGSVQPGIQSIDLDLTPLQPTWEDASGEGAEYVGTLKRRYEVDMTVDYTEGDLISEVTGEQVFYVKPVPTAQDGGVMIDVYQLIFWRDLGRPVGKVTTAGL